MAGVICLHVHLKMCPSIDIIVVQTYTEILNSAINSDFKTLKKTGAKMINVFFKKKISKYLFPYKGRCYELNCQNRAYLLFGG